MMTSRKLPKARTHRSVFDTLTRLPWPAGLAFGVAGFVVLRWAIVWNFADRFDGRVGAIVAKVLASGALEWAAWLVLVFGVVAAGLSFWRSGQRATLGAAQNLQQSVQALTWKQFEQVVDEAYRRRGYQVTTTGQGGYDGGVDRLLVKDGETTFVQCKHWRSRYVAVSEVRELERLVAQHRADAGKMICSGVFSTDCYRFAVGKPLELLDGEALYRLVAEVRADTMLLPPAD